MHNNLVSIIIPSYNNCYLLREMIESILCQSYTNWELIIIDDQSTDDTTKMLSDYVNKDKRIRFYIRNKEPKGAQVCRNIGLEKSRGEYICFFDSDDLIAPFCLRQRVKSLDSNPNIDFAVFPAIGFNRKPFDYDKVAYGINTTNNVLKEFIARRLPFVVWNNIYRRDSIINNSLIWDENILSLQDSDYNIQALLKNLSFKFINCEADYYYRMNNNQNSITKKIVSKDHIKSHCYYFDKLIKALPCDIKGHSFNEIISYILFFCNISKKSNDESLIQHILNNSWVNKQLFLRIKLSILYKMFYKIKSVSKYSKLYWILFPIVMLNDKFKFNSWRIKQNKFCILNNENHYNTTVH